MTKDGYYTSGEFAKKANVTLRTIRYYDRQGILKPSCRQWISSLYRCRFCQITKNLVIKIPRIFFGRDHDDDDQR